MTKFTCPNCNKTFEMNFWHWIFSTTFHWFDIFNFRDIRKTKCPHCGKKSYMKRDF